MWAKISAIILNKGIGVKAVKWGGGIIGTYFAYKGLDIVIDNYTLDNELKKIFVTEQDHIFYETKFGRKLSDEQIKILKNNDLKAYREVYKKGEDEDVEIMKWYEDIIKVKHQEDNIKKD